MKLKDLGLKKIIKRKNGSYFHEGPLDLSNSKVTELPDNLTGSKIKKIPKKLDVESSLYLRNVPNLQNIPGTIKAHYIKIN